MPLNGLAEHFVVADRGLQVGVPVDELLAAINEVFLEERKERDASLCAEMETIEMNELDRLYQVEAEHEEMILTLDKLFAEIYNAVPAFVKHLLEKFADKFFHQKTVQKNFLEK